MGFGFLNAWMLIGLAGIALPVLAHLISKRRFDVVQWGAMRFLELGQRTRRRIRLQDLLLLLLRMGLLACLALALSRPWGSGGLLGALGSQIQHDYVFILDGSTSMAWEGGPPAKNGPAPPPGENGHSQTPHQRGVQWIYDALELMSPGDTVALIDARNQPRRLIAPPVTDLKSVRDSLSKLAGPAGTSQLPEAIDEALKILSTTSNVSRRIIILSDDQQLAWRPEDSLAWARVEDLQQQMQVTPVLDVVSLLADDSPRTNFSVGRLELSRPVTVPEFPVKIRAMIRQSGGQRTQRRTVKLEINGQPIPNRQVEVDVPPNGEVAIEFDHVFSTEGAFLVSVVIDPDPLPQDNRSQAVALITSSIPVLLVDGDPRVDRTRSETFYLQSVFASSGTRAPWVKPQVIAPAELNETTLSGQRAVFLCNVSKLTQRQWEILRKYVRDGGGLILAPGDRVDTAHWNQIDQQEQQLFLPAHLQLPAPPEQQQVVIDSDSLHLPWLQTFRQEKGVDLTQTRLQKWFRLEPVHPPQPAAPDAGLQADGAMKGPAEDPDAEVLARLSNGDPWLVSRSYGYGSIYQFATPLDADWSTFPAKNDFVPFLHELVFQLAGQGQQRNVDVGTPLLLELKPGENASDFLVNGPGVEDAPAEATHRGRIAFAQFSKTAIPGVYRFESRQAAGETGQPFVVDDDHAESNLAPLSADDWKMLIAEGQLHRVEKMQDVQMAAAGAASRAELWWLLLLLVLLMMICEVALTRKMVQGGHAALDEALASS